MLKSDIRKEYKEKRRLLSSRDKVIQSKQIAQLVTLNFDLETKVVSVFLPIERLNEVDTSFLIGLLKKSNTKVYTPVSDFKSLGLRHLIYNDETIIKKNKWGIPEPINGEEIEPEIFDVVFVPLLATDKKGNRVGYGKGFYDRFLSQCNEDTIFIGLSYFDSLVEIDDVNDDDISLHFLVSPNRITKF